jgi:hypothetical protein
MGSRVEECRKSGGKRAIITQERTTQRGAAPIRAEQVNLEWVRAHKRVNARERMQESECERK